MPGWEAPLSAWLDAHDDAAPGVVEGLYVVGSHALGDATALSDIDIVAVLAEPPDDEVVGELRTAHALFTERHQGPPVDGPYVSWGDLSVPAMAVQRPWSLDGAFHHDGECFELNPVVWHVLATAGIALRGPTPGRLGVSVTRDELVRFVLGNIESYWDGVVAAVRTAATSAATGTAFDRATLEWCVLGAARMRYTVLHRDVASKSTAGRVARADGPHSWSPAIDLALRHRAEADPDATVSAAALADAMEVAAAMLAHARRVGA
jgi:hypothetical protein